MDKDHNPTLQNSVGMTGMYTCPTCKGSKSHDVLAVVNTRDTDCDGQVFFLNHYLTVKCNGCATVSFCHVWEFSEDEEYGTDGTPYLVRHRKHYPDVIEEPDPSGTQFIDPQRIVELSKIKDSKHDTSRLLQLLNELDQAYQSNSHHACIFLIRAILDHVPPIFGLSTFSVVANNYGAAGRSFTKVMLHLENTSRAIADAHLHMPIRQKESLPTKTQVEFRADLDVLLAEIVRLLHTAS